MINRTILNY